jgi:hypothetical protein
VESKWKNYHIITFPGQSLSKTLEEAMDLSRDRLILELELVGWVEYIAAPQGAAAHSLGTTALTDINQIWGSNYSEPNERKATK